MVLAFHEGFETGSASDWVNDLEHCHVNWLRLLWWELLNRWSIWKIVRRAIAEGKDVCKFKKGAWYRWNNQLKRWFRI